MTKQVLLFIFCWLLLLPEGRAEGISPPKRWSFSVDNRVGGATYEEKESTITSEWRNIYFRTDLGFDNLDDHNTALKIKTNLSFFITPADTETWHVSDVKYQTNDMDFLGINPGLEAGYQFNNLSSRCSFAPFLGYNYKRIKFDRTNFNIIDTITSRDVVSEIYDIHYVDLGTYWDYVIDKKWDIFSRVSYGYVLVNNADNSALGKIDGGGGYLVKTDLGLEYQLDKGGSISFGGFFELQHLEGGSKDNVIWPDNDLNTYGVLIKYKV